MSENSATEASDGQDVGAKAKEKEKEKVKFESTMQRAEAVAYFQAIVEGLKQGSIQIKQGDKSLALTPPASLGLAVKASRKGDSQKISFELEWTQTTSDLEITSTRVKRD